MNQFLVVHSFSELISTPFQSDANAICWSRTLDGDFAEIIEQIAMEDNLVTIDEEELNNLSLSKPGQLAREIILNDLKNLKAIGASPVLNVIRKYDRDDSNRFFPTDVYSFHIDRSPVPTATFLCTYFGESSQILPNSQALKKVEIPAIRNKMKESFVGNDKEFEDFLREYFYDLHYQAQPDAKPISLGLSNLWKLAVDHPNSNTLPCIHRAPVEKQGQKRLLLIC